MRLDDIDFLIIGATKSATTWLQKSLQTDPQVAMPEPELHYFSREIAKGDDWYLAQFPENAANRVAGEKSNSYLESTSAAELIAKKLPKVKLVAQLRNPVERAYSDYCMLYRRGEIGRDVARHLDPGKLQNTRLISAGLYHQQLQAFYDRFPSDQILITFFEGIKTRPEEQIIAVREFIELPPDQAVTFIQSKVKDKTTPMASPGLRRALRPLKPIAALFRDTATFRKMHALLGRETSYAPLPANVHRQLVDYYARDVEALGRMIGKDVSAWQTEQVGATVTALKHRINVTSFAKEAAAYLDMNEIGVCDLSVQAPVAFDRYGDNRVTGAFILVDRMTNATVGAGMISHPLRRARNIHWQTLDVDRSEHAAQKHQKPAVLWFTGLSGSGKSTIANLLEKKLNAAGRHTYLLDGDNIRHGLNRDLGFTEEDRVENIRRVIEVARLMADAGLIVLVSFISPFRAERQMARERMEEGEFVEIFVDTPFEECARRDPKGLYARALNGTIKNFTGLDSPYEAPDNPELHLQTLGKDAEEMVDELESWLNDNNIVSCLNDRPL